ncbi:MAG TPA: SRPBCC family protein [Chthoniobacterales bacterium]|nr:SRPBCC family protein [Chthoniobacterales bacterium]
MKIQPSPFFWNPDTTNKPNSWAIWSLGLFRRPRYPSSRHRQWMRLLFCLGLPFFIVQVVDAEDRGEHPIKDLSNASKLIHWPNGFDPKETDAFVHNEIWIKASAKVIWENLVDAAEWPTWYSNSAELQIAGTDHKTLQANGVFTWKTFGFPIASKINEFVPESRIGWFGNGTGIHAYHTWLILEEGNGCRVVTEESQIGPSAIHFNIEQPTAMYDAHHWWLTALKFRSEQASAK